MRNVSLITQRELQSYLRTMSGYIIIAVMLFIDGLLFNAFAVPGTAKKSSEVLADFFTLTSGITMVGAVFLSMRLIAEERQTGTIALLYSSPIHDVEIVLASSSRPSSSCACSSSPPRTCRCWSPCTARSRWATSSRATWA